MIVDFAEIKYDLENLPHINLDIADLYDNAVSFYNNCQIRKNMKKNIYRVAEAKSDFLTCLNILKNLLEAEENSLIIKYKQENSHTQPDLDKYFENFLSKIDKDQKEIIKAIDDEHMSGKLIVPINIKNFVEELKDGMENVILYPLKRATQIYLNRRIEEREKKDQLKMNLKESFRFILFMCVLSSAKIKGSEKRQQVSFATSSEGNMEFKTINVTKGPRHFKQNPLQQSVFPFQQEQRVDEFESLFLQEGEQNV